MQKFTPPRYRKSDVDGYLSVIDSEREKLTRRWLKGNYPFFIITVFLIIYVLKIAIGTENTNEIMELVRLLFFSSVFSLFFCPVDNWHKKATLPEAERFLRRVLCYPLIEGARPEDIKKINAFCSSNEYYE